MIDITWKKSRTWGNNPHAVAFVRYDDGKTAKVYGRASGCGYDKLSQVVSDVLNRAGIARALHDAAARSTPESRPYGATFAGDYGAYLGGAVGMSSIIEALRFCGYTVEHRAGQVWDCVTVEYKKAA